MKIKYRLQNGEKPLRACLLVGMVILGLLVLLIGQGGQLSAAALINLARVIDLHEQTFAGGQVQGSLVPRYLTLANVQAPYSLANEILGDYYFHRAYYADAVIMMQQTRFVRPWVGWQMGFAYYKLGQAERAMTTWRVTSSASWIVRHARQMGDDPAADEFYLLALQVEPGHPQASRNLGIRYAQRARSAAYAEKLPEAQGWLSLAVELKVRDLTYAQLVTVTALKLGNYQLALDTALAGARDFPENDKIHELAAVAYAALGEYDLAIEQYHMAIAVSKRKPQFQMALADLYAELGKTTEATELYQIVYNSGDPSYRAKAVEKLARLRGKR